jgi:hypothetical protein
MHRKFTWTVHEQKIQEGFEELIQQMANLRTYTRSLICNIIITFNASKNIHFFFR